MKYYLRSQLENDRIFYISRRGRRVIGIFGSLIWSKTLMELRFNHCGEFRRSPEGPVSQIHSPHLYVGAPGIFPDILREATAPFQCLVKLQPWFLSLWWKNCLPHNCNLGSCACNEGPALGQITVMMMIFRRSVMN